TRASIPSAAPCSPNGARGGASWSMTGFDLALGQASSLDLDRAWAGQPPRTPSDDRPGGSRRPGAARPESMLGRRGGMGDTLGKAGVSDNCPDSLCPPLASPNCLYSLCPPLPHHSPIFDVGTPPCAVQGLYRPGVRRPSESEAAFSPWRCTATASFV